MNGLRLVILLLCSYVATGQAVKIQEPNPLATKEWTLRQIDSLHSLISDGGGGVPLPPVCEHNISIYDILKSSTNEISYMFHSKGVQEIKNTLINQNGVTVWQHVTTDVNTNRITVHFDVPPGVYTFKIENNECTFNNEGNTRVLDLQPDSSSEIPDPDPDPDPEPVGFVNKGVYSVAQNGKLYEWIPSEGIYDVEIINGKVRIIAPEVKKSFNGSTTCKRFLVVDPYDAIASEKEQVALFEDGLELPPGNYHFKILYIAAKSWDEFLKNKWNYIGFDGNGAARAAKGETLLLSITEPGQDQYRVSWFPQYFYLNEGLRLPDGKVFGITRYMANLDFSYIFNNATHIQNPGGVFNHIHPDKWWMNLQARPGTRQPDQVIREAPLSKGIILMSELAENYGNDENNCPKCYDKAEEVYKGLNQRAIKELGVSGPEETGLISDYFGPLYGYGLDIKFFTEGVRPEHRRLGLSNLTYARSMRHKDDEWHTSNYFSKNAYAYRGIITNGYINPMINNLGDPVVFGRVYQHEKTALAVPDRKKISYVSPQQEGLGIDYVNAVGTSYVHQVSGGEIIRDDAFTHSFETFKSEAFYSLLFGSGLIIWDSNLPLSDNPEDFRQSWYGDSDKISPWKTRWKKDGKVVTYDPNLPEHPKQTGSKGLFPERPSTAEQGAYVGAKLYEQFGEVYEVVWADYTRNGEKITANRGQDGTPRANVSGVQNFGQDNIVKTFERREPICLIVQAQNGRFLVFQDPFADLTTSQLISVEGKNFFITGNRLKVFKL